MKLHALKRLESAIPLSLVKPRIKGWNKNRYRAIFNKYGSGNGPDKYRIYIPVGESLQPEEKPPQEIVDALSQKGYTVESYKAGLAVDSTGKRKIRIGKLLSDKPDLLKLFTNDAGRAAKSGNLLTVISCHPYDVLGMSFDRGWTSCMDLVNGVQRGFLKADIDYGTVVAYLVKSDDKNINRPIARIAMRPAFKEGNITDPMILCAGPMYGQGNATFQRMVAKFTDWANSGSPRGEYKMPKKLYTDDYKSDIFYFGIPFDELNSKQLSVFLRANYLSLSSESLAKAYARTKDYEDHPAIDYTKRILELIARAPNCPTDIEEELVNSRYDTVRFSLASNISTHPRVLATLSKDSSRSVRTAVAQNMSCPIDLMHSLVSSEPYALANNEGLPYELFMKLVKHPKEAVRWNLAQNSSCPDAVLAILANDSEDDVREVVANNPYIPTELLVKFLTDSSEKVRSTAQHNLQSRGK